MRSPSGGAGRIPSRKRILAYFEGHKTVLFASVYSVLMLRVRQCVMTHLKDGDDNFPRCPNVDPRLPKMTGYATENRNTTGVVLQKWGT